MCHFAQCTLINIYKKLTHILFEPLTRDTPANVTSIVPGVIPKLSDGGTVSVAGVVVPDGVPPTITVGVMSTPISPELENVIVAVVLMVPGDIMLHVPIQVGVPIFIFCMVTFPGACMATVAHTCAMLYMSVSPPDNTSVLLYPYCLLISAIVCVIYSIVNCWSVVNLLPQYIELC